MSRHLTTTAVALAMATATLSACHPSDPVSAQFRTTEVDVAVCAFGQPFSLTSTNPYFPIGPAGRRWELNGKEAGATFDLTITMLNETEPVGRGSARVVARVVEEVEKEDGVTIEISRNFFAENADGTVCYFGEEVDIYNYDENGNFTGITHEGVWRADEGANFPGIIMPANPAPGMAFVMEGAPGTAEDEGVITQRTGRVHVDAGTFQETIRIRESNPLDGDFDFKVFARDVGIIVDGPLGLVRCAGGVVAPCTP